MGAQRRTYIKAYCTRCDTMVASNAWNRHRKSCDSKPAKPGQAEREARAQAGIEEYLKHEHRPVIRGGLTMEIKIDIRTAQAGVMLKTYLERVFAPFDFDLTVGGSVFIMRFKSKEAYDTMKQFLGFLENGFSVR